MKALAAWAALAMIVRALLGAEVEAAHAEIVKEADSSLAVIVPNIIIPDQELEKDFAFAMSRGLDLLSGGNQRGRDWPEWLIDGENVPFWQLAESIKHSWILGPKYERRECRGVVKEQLRRDSDYRWRLAEIPERDVSEDSRRKWRAADSVKMISENIGAITRERLSHFAQLFRGIDIADDDSGGADKSGAPQANYASLFPKPLAALLGCIFIIGAVKLLNYGFKRSDYFLYIGAFGGFIPFAIGATLLFLATGLFDNLFAP